METERDRESHATELGKAIDDLGNVVRKLVVESNNLEKILLGDIPGNAIGRDENIKEVEPGGVFEKLKRRVNKIEGAAQVVHDRLLELVKESNPKRARDEGKVIKYPDSDGGL